MYLCLACETAKELTEKITLNSKDMKTLNSSETSYTTSANAQQASESTSKMYRTTYSVAVNWLNSALVLCNRIAEIDSSVLENARFDLYDEDENPVDIFQFFITDCSDEDVEYLEKHFGLLFTYSELLECYILCVTHWGTSWDYVMIDTDLKWAEAEQGTDRVK